VTDLNGVHECVILGIASAAAVAAAAAAPTCSSNAMICAFKLRPISIAAAALMPAESLLPLSDAARACCDAILFLFSWRRDSSCEMNHDWQLRACAAACAD
jgi:hypothetical protein